MERVDRMRNLHQILRDKETDLARVRQEVEALRFVAPLLTEQPEAFCPSLDLSQPEAPPRNRWPLKVS